jgi:hypothetical protein
LKSRFKSFKFDSFFRDYDLPFQLNRWLVAPHMKTVKKMAAGQTVDIERGSDCHWLHTSPDVVASFMHCSSDHVVRPEL